MCRSVLSIMINTKCIILYYASHIITYMMRCNCIWNFRSWCICHIIVRQEYCTSASELLKYTWNSVVLLGYTEMHCEWSSSIAAVNSCTKSLISQEGVCSQKLESGKFCTQMKNSSKGVATTIKTNITRSWNIECEWFWSFGILTIFVYNAECIIFLYACGLPGVLCFLYMSSYRDFNWVGCLFPP